MTLFISSVRWNSSRLHQCAEDSENYKLQTLMAITLEQTRFYDIQ
jgi:hypothetical protein